MRTGAPEHENVREPRSDRTRPCDPEVRRLDLCARRTAQARGTARRAAANAAARLSGRLSFQRLGYRTQGDYAREELGTSARSLRRMATLGRRLAGLPKTRAAFERGALPVSKAECIARVATRSTERAWLESADRLPIKELRAVVQAFARGDVPAAGATTGDGAGDSGSPPASGASEPEERALLAVEVPAWMVGKAAAVLRLAGKVAGCSPPEGTRWEFIAAEYLSGAPLQASAEATDPASVTAPGVTTPGGATATGATVSLGVTATSVTVSDGATVSDNPIQARDPSGPDQPEASPFAHRDLEGTEGANHDSDREVPADAPLTPWQLHAILREVYAPGASIDLDLGALLRKIKDRAAWRDWQFATFDDYVRERLDLSSRTARRLIRLERLGRRHIVIRESLRRGYITSLQASMLANALELGLAPERARAWVEYARRMPVARLHDAVDWARAHAAIDPGWARTDGCPPHPSFHFEDSGSPGALPKVGASDACSTPDICDASDGPATTVDSCSSTKRCASAERCSSAERCASVGPPSVPWPKLAAFATSRLRLWLTRGEREVLERAIAAVRRAGGPDLPRWWCLNELLDHFAEAYEDPAYARLSRRSPVLERDDWQCQAPGCRARSSLQVHHILARGVGGPDTFDNLVVLCDFHHLAIHRGWIGCWGKAPDRIRWSFGVNRRPLWFADSPYTLRLSQALARRGTRQEHEAADSLDHAGGWVRPIAEFVGPYRLRERESFPEVERRLFGRVTRAGAAGRGPDDSRAPASPAESIWAA